MPMLKADTKPVGIIEGSWADFKRTCIHPDAGPTQLEECKKAFYAGAMAVMQANITIADGDLTEVQGVQLIEGIWQECLLFAKGLLDNGPGGLTDEELKIKSTHH